MSTKGKITQSRRALRTRRLNEIHAAISVGLWFAATGVMGADWFFQPAVSVGIGYESNAQLTAEDPISTSRYDIDALARGGRRTERSDAAFSLRAFSRRYPGAETLNSDNLSAGLASAYQLNELSTVRLDGSFERSTSRISELTTTGNIQGNVPRNSYWLQPSWTRELTELSTVGISYSYTNVRYEENLTGLIDYDQHNVDASYDHRLTERTSLAATLAATYYTPEDPVSYRGYEATLGFSYALSETLTGDVFYGPQQIDSETDLGPATIQRTERSSTYGIRLAKKFERGALNLELKRGAVPTGAGEPLLQERLIGDLTFHISPTLGLSFPAGIYRSKPIGFVGSEKRERRIYFSSNPALIRRFSDDFVLSASYRYEYQRFESSGESASSNTILFSLSYVWPAN